MKYFAPIITLLVCTSVIPAYAAPVTVEFTGTISRMNDYTDGGWAEIQSSDALGYNVSAGEQIKSYFSYDTQTVLPISGSPWGPREYLLNGNFQQSVKFANATSAISYNKYNYLQTYEYSDSLVITMNGVFDGNIGSTFYSTLEWQSPYAPLDGYLPAMDQWSNVTGEYRLNLPSAERGILVFAQITSAKIVSSVPEPSTYLMLATGIGLMLLSSQARRTALNAQNA